MCAGPRTTGGSEATSRAERQRPAGPRHPGVPDEPAGKRRGGCRAGQDPAGASLQGATQTGGKKTWANVGAWLQTLGRLIL